jgi:hypothetical protein
VLYENKYLFSLILKSFYKSGIRRKYKKNIFKSLALFIIVLLTSCRNPFTLNTGFYTCCKPEPSSNVLVALESPKSIKKGQSKVVSIYFGHYGYYTNVNGNLIFNTSNNLNLDSDPWNLFGFQVNLDDKVLYSGKIENFKEVGELKIKNGVKTFQIKTSWKIDLDLIEMENNSTKEIIIRIVSVDDYATLSDKPLVLFDGVKYFGSESLFIHRKNNNYEFALSSKWND